MKLYIDEIESKELAYQLKHIYYSAVIEQDCVLEDRTLINIISEAIEENNAILRDFMVSNNDGQFAIDFHKDLTAKFLKKIDAIMQDVCAIAYSVNIKVGNTSDLMIVIVPYFLRRFSIVNDEISLFTGLAMVLGKIIVNSLSDKHKKTLSNSELKEVLQTTIKFFEKKKGKENQEYTEGLKEILNKCD